MSNKYKIELSQSEIDTIIGALIGAVQDCDSIIEDYTGYVPNKLQDEKLYLNKIIQSINNQCDFTFD